MNVYDMYSRASAACIGLGFHMGSSAGSWDPADDGKRIAYDEFTGHGSALLKMSILIRCACEVSREERNSRR